MPARPLKSPAALPYVMRIRGVGNVSRVWWLRNGYARPCASINGRGGRVLLDPREPSQQASVPTDGVPVGTSLHHAAPLRTTAGMLTHTITP